MEEGFVVDAIKALKSCSLGQELNREIMRMVSASASYGEKSFAFSKPAGLLMVFMVPTDRSP